MTKYENNTHWTHKPISHVEKQAILFQAYQQNESDSRVSNSSSFSESGHHQVDQDQQLQETQNDQQPQQQQQEQNGQQPQQQEDLGIKEDNKGSSSNNGAVVTTTTATATEDTPSAASSSDPLRPMSASTTASAFNSSFLPTVEEERDLAAVETSGSYFTYQLKL